MNNLKYYLFFLLCFPMLVCFGQIDTTNHHVTSKKYKIRAIGELGFLGVFDHKIQFGKNTTYFDCRKDGGQDILFAVARLSLEIKFGKRNTIALLYQPLQIKTQVVLRQDVRIDDVLFPAASNLNFSYGFPFYRLSYLRDLRFKGNKLGLALGASLQIRNANIKFESSDGRLLQKSSNVGIVPLLKLRAYYKQTKNLSLELEADGIYAPISYLNGSDNEVLGSLLDISLRQNFQLIPQAQAFLSLRYIGGGAQGTSDDIRQVSDGFSKNWLHFYTVTAGFVYEF